MKRWISQGQAIRSIFGCSRVTHLLGVAPMSAWVGAVRRSVVINLIHGRDGPRS
jgi:hypothetical protein